MLLKLKILLTLLIPLFSAIQLNAAEIEDIANHHTYQYTHIKKQMEENACIDYKNLTISIPQFVAMTDTSVQGKINRSIFNLMITQLNQISFRYKLTNHAINAEVAYLKNEVKNGDKMVTCDINQSLYAPSINRVNYNFSTPYNNIIALSITYTYSASVKNSKRLVDLRYINTIYLNLKTGEEYTIDALFKSSSFQKINALIQSKYKAGEYLTWRSEFVLKDNYYHYGDYNSYSSEEDYDYEVTEAAEDVYDDEYQYDYEDTEIEEVADYESDYDYEEVVEEAEVESPMVVDNYPYVKKDGYRNSRSDGDGIQEISPNSTYSRLRYNSKKGRKLEQFKFNENALVVFNVSSFTFIIPAFQLCNVEGFGKSIAMRLTLEDLKPFIHPKGPFASLLNESFGVKQNYYAHIKQIEDMNSSLNDIGVDMGDIAITDTNRTILKIATSNPNLGRLIRVNGLKGIDTAKTKIINELVYENGLLISKKTLKADGSIGQTIYYTYDKNKNLITYERGYMDKPNYSEYYSYDPFNNLTKKEIRSNGVLDKTIYFSYRNNSIFEEHFQPNNSYVFLRKLSHNQAKFIDTILSYQSASTNKIIYHYDSSNQIIARFNPSRSSINNLQYRNFDQKNRLIAAGDNRVLFEYSYDENDNLLKEISRKNNRIYSKRTYKYDDQDRLVRFQVNRNKGNAEVFYISYLN